MNTQFIKGNISRFNSNTRKFIHGGLKNCAWIDEVYCFIRHGCSPDDYFRYEFYKKSDYERSRFITYRRSQRLIKQYNDPQYIKYFKEKQLFNEKFSDFLGREWLDCNKASWEEFVEFVHRHKEVLMKPLDGGQGKGIYKLTESELTTIDYNTNRHFLCEQIIQQHSIMSSLNNSSVNSVRVLTFKGQVIACALRIGGTGAIVDNLHSNGVCAHLDLKTGIIDNLCINNQLEKFLYHPGSHLQLVGFRIPNWDKVIETAKAAAMVVPQVQYVGWDIAVTETGTALIEGNHDPGHDVVQMIAQTGLYNVIRNLE